MDEPRRILIHRSLNRATLILGGDRDLVLGSMLIAAMIAFTASSWVQLVIAGAFWLFTHSMLVEMAKHDPFMFPIIMRHIRYKPFYPAQTGMHAQLPNTPKWKG